MPIINSWTPSGTPSLSATVGVPFTQIFDYHHTNSNDDNDIEIDVGFVTADGGTTYIQAGAFPGIAGLSISAGSYPIAADLGTLTITGTPTVSGVFQLYLRGGSGQVGTAVGSATAHVYRTFTLTISGSSIGLSPVGGTTLTPAQAGTAYLYSFSATNGTAPYNWTFNCPPGLTLATNPSYSGPQQNAVQTSGNIVYLVGTPTSLAVGTYTNNLHLTVTDGGAQVASGNYTLAISDSGNSGTLFVNEISINPPRPIKQAVPTTITYDTTGGVPPYTYSQSGTLPTGMSVSNSGGFGILSGTPTVAGTYNAGTIIVHDSVGAVGNQPLSLVVTSNMEIAGSLSNGTENVSYNSTLTASGGNGTFLWNIVSGLPAGIVTVGSLSTSTLTLGGSPGTGTSSGSPYTVIISVSDNVVTKTASYNVTIAPGVGGGGITITPTSGGNLTLTQGVASTIDFDGTGGVGAYTWSITSGTLPSGVTLNTSTGQLVGTPTGYGSIAGITLVINVVGATSGSGTATYTLRTNPNILFSISSLSAGVAPVPYGPVDLVVSGADGAGYTYQVLGLPNGMTATPIGTGNNTLRFAGTPTTAGSYNVTVNVTAPCSGQGSNITVQQILPLTITGTGVLLTPFDTAICARTSTTVKVGATVTGGATNQFTITPSAGTLSPAGPYSSGQQNIVYSPGGNSVRTLVFASVDDGAVTANETVTVTTGSTISSTVSPAGPVVLYGGQSTNLTATVLNGCSAVKGTWEYQGGDNGGGALDTFIGPTSRYTAPNIISSNKTIFITFKPFENTTTLTNVQINLVAGAIPSFSISTSSPLPNATQGSAYSQSLSTSAGTVGSVVYTLHTGSAPLPSGITLSSAGLIAGNPSVNGDFIFTVDATDNVATAVKSFALHVIDNGSSAVITNVTPNSTPASPGGAAVVVNGTGFVAGDVVKFESQTDLGAVVILSQTGLTGTTISGTVPLWTFGPQVVDVVIYRSSVAIAWKTGGFQFTVAGGSLSISSFSPTSIATGSGNTVINVFGTGFDGSSVINYTDNPIGGGGSLHALTTTYLSSTQIRATIPSTYFVNNTYVGTVATISVTRGSDSSSVTSPTALNITANQLAISTSSFAEAIRTIAYSQTCTATGGVLPYTWSIVPSNGLPLLLSIAPSTGIISGTPNNTSNTSTFRISVIDNVGTRVTSGPLTIVVSGGTPTIDSTSPLADSRINVAYSVQIAASGGTTPYNWSLSSGALPNGLSIGALTGIISGTPNVTNAAPSSFNFTVALIDSAGSPLTATKAYTMLLLQAIPVVTVTSITAAYGPLSGNTPVLITGTNFQNGCTVKFGNALASNVVFSNAQTISCNTPSSAAATFVNVIVTNPDTGVGTLTNGFEYRLITTPVIDHLSIQDGPFDGGQTVILYGNDFDGTTKITFGLSNTPEESADAIIVGINTASVPQAITVTTPTLSITDGLTFLPVNIYATNASGVGVIAAEPNGYTYRPPPIITGIVPNSGSTNGGSTFYVLGKNFFQRGTIKPRIFIGNTEVPQDAITLVES